MSGSDGGGLDSNNSLYGYLLKSVYNTAINYISKMQRSQEYKSWSKQQIEIGSSYTLYDPDANPVIRALYSSEMRSIINGAIDQLPKRRREIFRMSYIMGLSHKQISEELGLSVSTVENHIFLALQQLRTIILKTGVKK